VLRDRIGPLERQTRPLTGDDYDGIDVVLLSHLHGDHLDLASLRHLRGRPRFVVPRGSREFLRRHGFHDVDELAPGETLDVDGLRVEATAARHSGFRPPFGPTAVSLGFVVGQARPTYFAGDTGLFPGMSDIPEHDIALVPVGGWGPTLGANHLDPVQAAQALRLLRSRTAVPIHWGTLWPRGLHRVRRHRLTEPARNFVAAAAELAPGVRIAAAEPGESVTLGD